MATDEHHAPVLVEESAAPSEPAPAARVQYNLFGGVELIPVAPKVERSREEATPAQRKCSDHGRARSISTRELSQEEAETAAHGYVSLLDPPEERDWLANALANRPKTRADCLPGGSNEARPCPFALCRYHLGVEVREDDEHGEGGSLKIMFPNRDNPNEPDWDAMPETCVLDVADRIAASGQPMELEDIARVQNRSLERIRQLIARGEQDVLVQIRRRWDEDAQVLPRRRFAQDEHDDGEAGGEPAGGEA